MKRNIVRAPTKETISSFMEVSDFIQASRTAEDVRLRAQQREKVKMPFKMYNGIKNSVKKKFKESQQVKKSNFIVGETHSKPKLMSTIIENGLKEQIEAKKNKKLRLSHFSKTSRFKEGVLDVGKNFLSRIEGNKKSAFDRSGGKSGGKRFNKRKGNRKKAN